MIITLGQMGTPNLSDVLNHIIRLTVMHSPNNASSVLSVIDNLKACIAGQMDYNGYICFDSDGVKLIAATPMPPAREDGDFVSNPFEDLPMDHAEVWKVEISFHSSESPRFAFGHMYSKRPAETPKDRFLRMIHDRSIKVSTVKEPHTYMRAVGTKEIERILEVM